VGTQLRTFEHIVALTTAFPVLRLIFLRSKHLHQGMGTAENLAATWDRSDPPEPVANWNFWRLFAAACLSDVDISVILQNCLDMNVSQPDTNYGLSVIERLLIAYDSV
jgi:hypothetical protein